MTMLNVKKLDRLFAKFNISPADDPYLAMLHEAARLSGEHEAQDVQWTEEELTEALHGRTPLFASRALVIDRGEFLRVFDLIRKAADAAGIAQEGRQEMPDLENFFTQQNLDLLAKNPDALWDLVSSVGMDMDSATGYFVPVTAFAMRVFFDKAAAEASRIFDKMVPDTVHFKRSVACPVCGTTASVAGVGATQNHGNVKRLYCSCCGADWQFERIRCAVCGEESTSALQYVHMKDDDKHRLHVCETCQSAMPTVFGAESDDFDPEFETWRTAELMVAYEQIRKEAADKEALQVGNA